MGELAPFAFETLILGFDHRFARADLVAALTNVLAHHPAFTSVFVTHAGGAVERHDTGHTGLAIHQVGTLDEARAHAATHAPDLAGHPACADLWPDGNAGHILTVVLHPVLGTMRHSKASRPLCGWPWVCDPRPQRCRQPFLTLRT